MKGSRNVLRVRPFHFNSSNEALEVFEGLSCKSRMTLHTARGQTHSHDARMMQSFMKDKATETKANI